MNIEPNDHKFSQITIVFVVKVFATNLFEFLFLLFILIDDMIFIQYNGFHIAW